MEFDIDGNAMVLRLDKLSVVVTHSWDLYRWSWKNIPGPRGRNFWHLALPIVMISVIQREP